MVGSVMGSKHILGICGSPHREGNTAYALKYALRIAEGMGASTEYIALAELEYSLCDGCFACRSGECVHDDDMQRVYEAMRSCDGMILASPVYMGMVTGQMKVMFDRTVLFRTGGALSCPVVWGQASLPEGFAMAGRS